MDGQRVTYPGRGRIENMQGKRGVTQRKLTRDQAALIFQLQCEARAALLTIERVLDAAGYASNSGRSAIRTHVRVTRGVITNASDAP